MGGTTYLHSPGFSQKPCSSSQPGRQMAVEGRKEENILLREGNSTAALPRNVEIIVYFFPLKLIPLSSMEEF